MPKVSFVVLCFASFLVAASHHSQNHRLSADEVSLTESDTDPRSILTRIKIEIEGTVETPDVDAKAIALPLKVTATEDYYSRRLPSAGRDERAYRNLRSYNNASAFLSVGDEKNQSALPPVMKTIIADGGRDGLLYYAPEYVMSRDHIELLSIPGDPLAILPILPKTPVELNQEWPVDTWVAAMLTATEAVVDSHLNAKLIALDDAKATISFTGDIDGAIDGATTKIKFSGTGIYDRKLNLLSRIEYSQEEIRSIGAANPGMNVKAKTIIDRSVAPARPELSDDIIKSIKLDPGPKSQLLYFQPKGWKLRFFHDRDWHVFQEVSQLVVLRLIIDGSLISQCNVALIPKVAPGEHTRGELFQADIRKSLGDRLTRIASADEITNDDGLYIYRVIAEGSVNNLEMVWNYYLVTAPDGRQISFVFAVEPNRTTTLKNRDLSIVQSVQFIEE